jgi:hypothetical protein
MRLRVKRAHSPYPGVRFPVGFEMTIEPDEIARELVRRGFFDEIKPVEPEPEPKPKHTSKRRAEID